jgi:hypothetical protein
VGTVVDASGVLLATGRSPIREAAGWPSGDLLLAALGRSILDSLWHEAMLVGLSPRAQAVVTWTLETAPEGGTPSLREVSCRVELTLDPPRPDEEVARIAGAAERGCLVASALATQPRFEWVYQDRLIPVDDPDSEQG